MKDIKDFDWMRDGSDDDPLSLPYIQLTRLFLNLSTDARDGKGLSGGAMRMYLYIMHNSSVNTGYSHTIKIEDATKYFGKHESTIYRYLSELTACGLLKTTNNPGFVYDIPDLHYVKAVKKSTGIKADAKKRERAFENEIEDMINSMEQTLKRELTNNERVGITQRFLDKKRQS